MDLHDKGREVYERLVETEQNNFITTC